MSDTTVLEQTTIEIRLDTNWKVIFHNDDRTPMDFVVAVLVKVFNKTYEEAMPIMLAVHHNGQAVAATYSSYDIAEQKLSEVDEFNKYFEQRLKVTIEK